MDPKEKSRFDTLYQKNLATLTLQGKADKTIDAYTRAVRRLADFVDRCPDNLSIDELKSFFSALINTHSWSTVKLDLNGLRFFYKHVINQELPWIDIVKPPKVQSMPDILTPDEIARIIHQTRKYRTPNINRKYRANTGHPTYRANTGHPTYSNSPTTR